MKNDYEKLYLVGFSKLKSTLTTSKNGGNKLMASFQEASRHDQAGINEEPLG